MTDSLIYKKEFLFQDAAWKISNNLFKMRTQADISLAELSHKTAISLVEIDALESNIGDIDFEHIATLLDFYNKKLSGYTDCFPNLPTGYYEKYFN